MRLMPLLSDEQLVSLGVMHMGDRTMLKSISKTMKSTKIYLLFTSYNIYGCC